MPLENLLGPVGDLYCFSNIFRMLVVHYYKSEIVIFECPRYSRIKEEKLLKFWGASEWEISSTFWDNTGPFSTGAGTEVLRPKTALKNP